MKCFLTLLKTPPKSRHFLPTQPEKKFVFHPCLKSGRARMYARPFERTPSYVARSSIGKTQVLAPRAADVENHLLASLCQG